MKCFYHSADLDGHCSGAIIKKEYTDCEMIGIDYGDEFPWDTIEKDEIVFMVDFCLQPFEQMIRLNGNCELIWIDHHKSAMEEETKYCKEKKISYSNRPIEGLRRIGIGACALVWEFLYPQRQVPYGVKLLAEYDVWNHENPETLPFQYGMRIENTLPDSYIWPTVFSYDNENFITERILEGGAILRYVDQYNEMYAKGSYFITQFEGYKCMAINKGLTNSQLFDSVVNDTIEIMIAFSWRKEKWIVFLYSSKVDVSIIAKSYKGGGHKGAAGFSCDTLPFSFKLKKIVY